MPENPAARIIDANQVEYLGCVSDATVFGPSLNYFDGPAAASYSKLVAHAISEGAQYVAVARTGTASG